MDLAAAHHSRPVRIFFLCDPQLNEDACSAYMDLDTTFGVKIAAVAAALGWSLGDWDFFFGPYEGYGLTTPLGRSKYRTPRDFDMDDTDEVEILCVPARANN